MAVAAFKILDDLRQTLDDGVVLEGIEIAAAEAARIMEPVRVAAVAALNTAREELAVALKVEGTAKAADETPAIDGPVGRGGQRPAKTNRATATEQLAGRAADAAALAGRTALRKDVIEAGKVVRAKMKHVEDEEKAFDEWQRTVGPVTEAEFIKYGQASVQPGYDYFKNLYTNPDGKLRNLFLAFRGALIFDPMFLAEITVTAAHLLINDLLRFGFEDFTPPFISGMKLELKN
jgi:hypothetical protein